MLYEIAHVVVSILARIFLRLRVVGGQNIPTKGGAIIASNHVSYLDIPLLGCALDRRADYLGKSELFRNKLLSFFFRRLGGIPIRRGGVDRSALTEVVTRLKAGRLVVYYPEGKRSRTGELQPLKPGIGMVAARAGVPIVPAFIEGTVRILPKQSKRFRLRPVVVKFGPPVDPSAFGDREDGKAFYLKVSHAVRDSILKLQNEKFHAGTREDQIQHVG